MSDRLLGTRTEVGSRVVALLASVIDTCRQRGHTPWRYLERAIANRRAPAAARGVNSNSHFGDDSLK